VTISLQDVLAHPVMREAHTGVLSGAEHLGRPVRWVHSSEIYEIAPLLQGGELLLSTGLGLAGADEPARRSYIRQLARRGVAAVGIELGRTMADIPPDMVHEAVISGLPILALRAVVPFVKITEAINGSILNSSIARLRHADRVSQALSERLMQGCGLDQLLQTLAELVGTPVFLLGHDRHVIAASPRSPDARGDGHGPSVPVTMNGAVLATLVFGHSSTEEPELVQAALDRAPVVVALELLRSNHQLTSVGRLQIELHGKLLADKTVSLEDLSHDLRAAGLPTRDAAFVGCVMHLDDPTLGVRALHDVGQHVAAAAVISEVDGLAVALFSGPKTNLGRPFADAVRGALQSALPQTLTASAGVGPPTTSLAGIQRSVREARTALELSARTPGVGPVACARALSVERLLFRGADPTLLREFVGEQLGPLLDADQARHTQLVKTLEAYLANGQRKAQTARELHLRRQSLYQRLTRIETLLGTSLDDPHQLAAIVVALRGLRLMGGADGVAAGLL
jgi:purine catabolism regulator